MSRWHWYSQCKVRVCNTNIENRSHESGGGRTAAGTPAAWQQQPPQPDDCKLLHHFAAWPWDLGDLKDLSNREGKVHQTEENAGLTRRLEAALSQQNRWVASWHPKSCCSGNFVWASTWPPSVRCWHPFLCLVYPTLGCDLARAVNRYLFFLAQHSYPDVTAHLHIVSS